jgi:hypothetical protein
MQELGFEHKAKEVLLLCLLFRPEIVLSHNGKKNSSVSVAYAIGMKETHESISNMPNVIKYKEHHRQLRGQLKITAFSVGCRVDYTILLFSLLAG